VIFWRKKIFCPLCRMEFESVRVFSESVRIKSRDYDLKPVFEGVNAIFFQLVTCPHCYLTMYEDDFEKEIPEDKIKELVMVLKNAKKKFSINLGENKAINDAINQHYIAAAVYTVLENRRKLAEVYLKLAWLLREKGKIEEELIALAMALKNFEEYYKYEMIEEKEGPMILFYMAVINQRFGNKKEAGKWFSELFRRYGNTNSYYVKVGKERWQDLRSSLSH